jgi:hypothetical protein
MGDVYSTGYINDNATPPVKHIPQDGGGRVRYYRDTYVQGASAGTIGDVIHMKKLPCCARIIPGGMIFWGTGTTNETLAVGITGTAAKFLAATAAATAGSAALEAHLASGLDYITPAAGVEVIVTDATAAIAAAQAITVHIPYVLD